MRIFQTLLLILISFSIASAQNTPEKWSKIKIDHFNTVSDKLPPLGIALDDIFCNEDNSANLYVTQTHLSELSKAGISFTIIHEDAAKWFSERLKNNAPDNKTVPVNIPQGFKYGSMGSYLTMEETMAQLDSMHARFPNITSARLKVSDQSTVDGNHLYYLKISNHPDVEEQEPKVLFTALHHARELITPHQLVFFMYHLLENYETDSLIKKLIDTTTLYFIPVVNPDGLTYNQLTNPDGGGMWRKNRLDNGDGTFGVDLNRNYGYKWGLDDIGSSPSTWSDTYRGTSPFSEIETQIMRDFCIDQKFSVCLNYHSYSNFWLYSWAYTDQGSPDSAVFRQYAYRMTASNGYKYGQPGALLYNTNGDALDWMYGEQTLKPKIVGFTPEMGSDIDGFWPEPDRIIPLCQEVLPSNILAIKLAGRYSEVKQSAPLIQPEGLAGEVRFIKYSFKRLGQAEVGTYSVWLESLDPRVTTSSKNTYVNPILLQSISDSLPVTFATSISSGYTYKLVLKWSDGFITYADTIERYVGPLQPLFNDPCDNMSNWTSSKWGNNNYVFASAPASITDSPVGNYSGNQNNIIQLKNPINLKDKGAAVIQFKFKHQLERIFDFVQLQVSIDNSNWTSLKGLYTVDGGTNIAPGLPIYTSVASQFIEETCSLTPWLDTTIYIRFALKSNSTYNYDGFYFDDFKVLAADLTIGIDDKEKSSDYFSNPYPSPSSQEIKIDYQTQNSATISIYSIDGIKWISLQIAPGNNTIGIDTKSLPQGLYIMQINSLTKKDIYTKKFSIVR